MHEENSNMAVTARLFGGPSAGVRLTIEPDPRWASPWPGYICLDMHQGMAMHYVLASAGVYEFGGACAEFDHDPDEHQRRCPDCGAKILEGSEAHPEHRR
jgi:hypothetical protein